MKFLRLLNGETTYKNFEFLYAMLKVTVRDRSVQRESVWRNQPGNKQGEYLSNVAIGYGKTAILHIIDLEANVDFLKANPKVEKFLKKASIPLADIAAQNLKMNKGEKSEKAIKKHAEDWIKANQKTFNSWIN